MKASMQKGGQLMFKNGKYLLLFLSILFFGIIANQVFASEVDEIDKTIFFILEKENATLTETHWLILEQKNDFFSDQIKIKTANGFKWFLIAEDGDYLEVQGLLQSAKGDIAIIELSDYQITLLNLRTKTRTVYRKELYINKEYATVWLMQYEHADNSPVFLVKLNTFSGDYVLRIYNLSMRQIYKADGAYHFTLTGKKNGYFTYEEDKEDQIY
jgi:hypothetical protein